MKGELAPAGTGARVAQLQLFGDYVGVFERQRARECEARVQAAGPHPGERLLRGIPPYIKWPIWRVHPVRDEHLVPGAFGALREEIGPTHGDWSGPATISRRTFNLGTVPRVVAEVNYLAGELGSHDRRVLCALCQNAAGSENSPSGYAIRLPHLHDILGMSRRHRGNYESLPGCLWRLGRTVVHLSSRDELSGTWGTEGFVLVSRVVTRKSGREWIIEYEFPEPANAMIRSNSLCTVDIHRLRAMRSPAAENLYCLVYDVAQWSRLKSVTYSLPDLVQRLGVTINSSTKSGRRYFNWSRVERQIHAASERVYAVGQCLSDYQVEGRGAEASVRYFLTDGPTRKTHLPPD